MLAVHVRCAVVLVATVALGFRGRTLTADDDQLTDQEPQETPRVAPFPSSDTTTATQLHGLLSPLVCLHTKDAASDKISASRNLTKSADQDLKRCVHNAIDWNIVSVLQSYTEQVLAMKHIRTNTTRNE